MTEKQNHSPLGKIPRILSLLSLAHNSAPRKVFRALVPQLAARKVCLLALISVLSFGSYRAISHFFVETVEVVGISMCPTLVEKNHYLLDRWAFHNREPKRDDVVVIIDPGDHGHSVKRIIALGGESVYFKRGKVYVNGRELKEPYLAPYIHTFAASHDGQLIQCAKDEFVVLGDNRPRSIDSRVYGPVSRKDILGLVMVK